MYGTFSQGFRRGGTNAVPLTGTFAESPAWLHYAPDTTNNYEVGIKGTTGDSFYNISLFYVDWKDIQLNTSTTNWGFYAAQNGSSAHTSGIEIEYDKYFGNNWHMNLGYAYTKGKLDEVMWSADNVYIVAPKGQKLPGLSDHTINAMLENVQDMSNGWQWVNRLSAYYQSDSENAISSSASFAQNLDSFSIWSFNSNIMINDWTVGLFVKNLFNERGVVGVYKEEYMGTAPSEGYYGNGAKSIVARPRTIGVTVSYDF